MEEALRLCIKEVTENGGTMKCCGRKEDGSVAFLVVVTREADLAERISTLCDAEDGEAA